MVLRAALDPEQARSARKAQPTSDVWSFGVMLYEVLAGELTFDGETVADFDAPATVVASGPPASVQHALRGLHAHAGIADEVDDASEQPTLASAAPAAVGAPAPFVDPWSDTSSAGSKTLRRDLMPETQRLLDPEPRSCHPRPPCRRRHPPKRSYRG